MDKKENYTKFVENNPMFRQALAMAESDEEREKLRALTLGLAEQVAEAFVPVIDKVKNDPEFATKLRTALRRSANGEKEVVIDNENKE